MSDPSGGGSNNQSFLDSLLGNIFGTPVKAPSSGTPFLGNAFGNVVQQGSVFIGPPRPPEDQIKSAPTWTNFSKWGAAFAVFSVVMVGLSESDRYGDAAKALVWLVAAGSTFYWWQELDVSLAELLGKSTVLSKSG